MKFSLLEGKIPADNFWTAVSIGAMGLFILSGFWFGQSLSLYILVLLVCLAAALFSPAAVLNTIIVLTIWLERHFTLQELTIGEQIYKIYPLDFLLLFLIISVGWRWLKEEARWRWQKFDWPILLFAALASLTFAVSLFLHRDSALAFSTYKNYALYGIVFVLAVLILEKKEDWQNTLRWFFIGGLGLFFFVAYGLLSGHGLWSEFTPLSTFGERLLAGTHAFYLALFAFYLGAKIIWPLAGDRRWQWFYKLLLILAGLGLAVSLVRHLWLALAALAVLWLVIFSAAQRRWLLSFAGKIAGGAVFLALLYVWLTVLFSGSLPDSFNRQFYIFQERANLARALNDDASFGWRLSVWQEAVSRWQGSPVVGIGFGAVLSGLHELTPFAIAIRDLHNDYLGILLQTGLVGLGLVIYWFWQLLKHLWRLWQETENDVFHRQMVFTWGNVILLFMIIFSISVYWDINLFVIWWWIALAGLRFTLAEIKNI